MKLTPEFTELDAIRDCEYSDRYFRCVSGRSLDKRQESGVCRYIWLRNRWWSKTGNSAVRPS
jgi:hypothetical protein